MSFFKSNKNKNKIVYNIVNISENTKDKECIDADNKNEKKYRDTVTKINKETKKWENTGVNLTLNIIPPPTPNNYDRLIDFRKKNVLRPAILQSQATLYLYNKNYTLGKDYDAYQAIEVADKLRKYEKQTIIDNEEQFQNDLINDDNVNLDILNLNPNIERRRVRSKSLIFSENEMMNDLSNSINENTVKQIQSNIVTRSRSKSLTSKSNKKFKNQKTKNRRPSRSISLDNNPNLSHVDENSIGDIDEIIDDFDIKSQVNNTQKEDLYPNIQPHIVFPSAPPAPLPSAPSAPSAPPRTDDDYYPRKNSLEDTYSC